MYAVTAILVLVTVVAPRVQISWFFYAIWMEWELVHKLLDSSPHAIPSLRAATSECLLCWLASIEAHLS